ncbi:hypothetical protein [Cellulomonas bogoriensis]|nr:hypothetical protein [Cellulomonas bogoriensis]
MRRACGWEHEGRQNDPEPRRGHLVMNENPWLIDDDGDEEGLHPFWD